LEYETWNILSCFFSSYVKPVLNSSLTSSLVGAFAGAYAAMRFADHKERDKIAVERLNATNASVILAASIANHAMSFKKQLSKDICDHYQTERQRLQDVLAEGNSEGPALEIQYDFRNISLFEHEGGELKALVIRKTAAPETTVMATFQLSQSLHSLEGIVEGRTSEIARLIELKDDLEPEDFSKVYFGLPNSEGHIDERFHDLVIALEDLTDSVVFFSTYIAKKMGEQSTKLAKEIGKKAPKAVVWSFDNMDPEHEELIPKGEAFPDWK
jgi:gas vesicle protein